MKRGNLKVKDSKSSSVISESSSLSKRSNYSPKKKEEKNININKIVA